MSEFQHLSKAQIYSGLPGVSFSDAARRSKKKLIDEVSLLNEAQKAQLRRHVQSLSGSSSRKRRAEPLEQHRNVRQRHVPTPEPPTDQPEVESASPTGPFLHPPASETLARCYNAFVSGTGNQALSSQVCAVCATEHPANEGEKALLSELAHRDLLKPAKSHPAHQLFGEDGILLSPAHVWQEDDEEVCWVCRPCHTSLSRGELPELALANDLWVGPVPPCLEILTLPEQMLIARHYTRVYVFKMYPKRGGGTWLPSDQRQRGMKGNVVSFRWNTNRVVDMLEGKIAPRQLKTLASVIAVSFIGSGKLPERWLRATFRVRRQRVLDALLWLKQNNPLYHDIEIDMDRINQLPEDDVPEAITANIRQTADATQAARESETYVPTVEEDTPGMCEKLLAQQWLT